MTRLLIFVSVLCFSAGQLHAQIPMGTWRTFTPNKEPLGIERLGAKIYVAFENGLFEYDTESGERNLWTISNYLSDVGLTALEVHEPTQTLVIAYENGNIDLLRNNTLYNLPALLISSVSGNKRIFRMTSDEEFVYVACGIAILKLNPLRREIADTYYPFPTNTAIIDVAFQDETIFAVSATNIRYANKSNIALADFAQWQNYNGLPDLGESVIQQLLLHNGKLFLSTKTPVTDYSTDAVFSREDDSFVLVEELSNKEIHEIQSLNNQFYLSADGALRIYDADLNQIEIIFQYDENSFIAPNGALSFNGSYYLADRILGLVKARDSYNHEKLLFQGPFRNSFFNLDFQNGLLLCAGGGLSGFNQSFNTSGVYLFEDEVWRYINGTNTPEMSEETFDVISVSIDPNDKNHFAFGTYSKRALFEVKDGSTIDAFYTDQNSPLETTTLGNNSLNVAELNFDNNSNLWIGQSYTNFPLKVKTAEGIFQSFDLGSTPKARVVTDLAIDFNGYKWLATRGGGIVVFNDNETILDPSDDQYITLRNGAGLGNLPSDEVTAVCVDFNNDVWIGTDNGLVVLYNSNRIFEEGGTTDAQPILIEFEEEIERLLGNTAITKIVLDGGNRKWVATESAGVILFVDDGREEVYNFNTSNSPLMSDNVRDIAINDITGEVFFVTEKGLQSFRSDASASDAEYNSVQVFPNPYRPDFQGLVSIQGIAYESEVRITDSAGQLVFQTVSNGGTAVWDGKTLNGERAASGVYQIWTAPRNGPGRFVGKFVLIN
jgi:hypothetical protein